MFHLVEGLKQSGNEYTATMKEVLSSTLRKLLVTSGCFWLVCALIFSSNWGGDRILGLIVSVTVVGLIFILAYWLVPRNDALAFYCWLTGMVAAILFCSWLVQNNRVVLFGAVLPLIALITISQWAGLAIELILVALAWLATWSLWGEPISVDQAILVVVAGAFSGLLGWAARSELLILTTWSISGFEQARKNLEEMREQQLELEQSREDLIQANRELTRLSNRLNILERIAEEARQAKTEFVANVSHELRTPLNMIIGFADVIARSPHVYGGHLPPALLSDITAIRRNAEHLSALVNDVLDLSQVEAGRMALSRDWVSVDSMITAAQSVARSLFESKGLYLHCEVEPNLPPLFCDETRIRQVIINLLGNAGRFTARGGVTLRALAIENTIVISVEDTGSGIAQKDQLRIFEPFQQADVSTRRRHGGSGLGLTISKQFVEMHGGKMWLQSEINQGTTISFSLPVELPPTALTIHGKQSLHRAINSEDEIGYRLRTRRPLAPAPEVAERFVVIDSEQILPRLLHHYMPEIEVEVAADVADAVEALRRSPAQALVVNVSPFETMSLATLGNLPFGTPAISCWLPGEQEAARRLGVVDYLIKPLARERLLAVLEKMGETIKTVLIVDDEEDELHLFARMLEAQEARYSILQVTTGQRALSMLRSRKPDVILLDLMMPGMNGFQVLAEKAQDPTIAHIPTIIISSRDPSGDPIVGNTLTVTQASGLSQRNLIACIHAVGQLLAPPKMTTSE